MALRDLIWKREYLVPDDDDNPEQTEDIDETANWHGHGGMSGIEWRLITGVTE